MLLSALSFLVVAQSSSEVAEGLMNNPVYFNQQNALIKNNKTDNKLHLMLGTHCYMFRYQGAIFREFMENGKSYFEHVLLV